MELVYEANGVGPVRHHAQRDYCFDRSSGRRAKVGDATSAEITDAESTLTRAQQAYLNSIHDYLIALARLEYAMGVTPTPGSAPGHRQAGCQ